MAHFPRHPIAAEPAWETVRMTPTRDIAVRPARPADARQVGDTFLAARAESLPHVPPLLSDAETRDYLAGLIDNPQFAVWVAEHAGEVVGFLALRETWVDHLYVRPAWYRRGVGTTPARLCQARQSARAAADLFPVQPSRPGVLRRTRPGGGAPLGRFRQYCTPARRGVSLAPGSLSLEPLLPHMADWIGEVAVQPEAGVLYQRVDAEMEALHRLPPPGDALERLFQLRQIAHFHNDVELAHLRRRQSQLAPGNAPPGNQSLLLQVAHVGTHLLAERDVADARLQVAPDVIQVHLIAPDCRANSSIAFVHWRLASRRGVSALADRRHCDYDLPRIEGQANRRTGSMNVEVHQDQRGVATVTIANAAKLNTLNPPLMQALIDAVEALGRDAGLRAVILRGEGDRAFIGGADITTMATLDQAGARAFITQVHRSCDVFRRLPVPVIGRIQGYVLGAGLEVTAACDFRVAAEDAVFGMPEVRIGLPSVVEAALLPGLIGWGRTRQLLLTGDNIDGRKAEAWGLVEQVVPAAELDAAVERLVQSILDSGSHAVRLQKALIAEWETLPPSAAIQRGIDRFTEAYATEEPRRMMAGFLDRQRARKLQRGNGGLPS